MLFVLLGFFVAYLTYSWLTLRVSHGTVWHYPLIGALPTILQNLHRAHDWWHDYHRSTKCRTLAVNVAGNVLMSTTDKANVEHMLKTKWQNYTNGAGQRGCVLKDLLGNGIFAADGELWREQRKTASREFSANRFRSFMGVEFVNYSTELCNVVADHAKAKKAFDLNALFFQLTLDAFGHIAFGLNLGGLKGTPVPFAASFDSAQERMILRFNEPIWVWKLLRFFNIGAEKVLRKHLQTCNTFVYSLIQARRDKVGKGLNLENDIDLLSRCMDVSDSEVVKDDVYLRDMVINFLIAGRDTTACALSWLFYELALNPDVEKQLREEIDASLRGAVPIYDTMTITSRTYALPPDMHVRDPAPAPLRPI